MSEFDTEERIEQAIRRFEKIQKESNIQWLDKQVRACEASDTDFKILEKRREELAKALKYTSWISLANHHDLASVDELLAVDVGQHDKGTRPPAPADQLSTFLQRLHQAINEDYDHDAPDFRAIDLPEDYVVLLKQTDGLRDTDLRNSRVCGVNSIRNANIAKMTGQSPYNITRGRYNIDNIPWGGVLWKYGWDVSTGFCLGGGQYHGNPHWLAYYYCSRTMDIHHQLSTTYPGRPDTIKECEQELKWRVFYKEPERFQHSFFHPMIFNDLAEWLEFYQEWWVRESVDYPAGKAKKAAEVELLCSHESESEYEGAMEEPDMSSGTFLDIP